MKVNMKSKNLFTKIALIIEFSLFAIFAFLTFALYYGITHQPPIPPEQQLDNDFVPLLLLFLLFAGMCIFGLAFAIHFSLWHIKRLKEKRDAVNRFK